VSKYVPFWTMEPSEMCVEVYAILDNGIL